MTGKKAAPPTLEEAHKPQRAEEAAYAVEELAANAKKLFGQHPDIAKAALVRDGKPAYPLAEARRIIKAFAERKV